MTAPDEQQPQPLDVAELRVWALLDLELPEDGAPVRFAWRDLADSAGYPADLPGLYLAASRLVGAGWLELHRTRPRDPHGVTVSRLVPRGQMFRRCTPEPLA